MRSAPAFHSAPNRHALEVIMIMQALEPAREPEKESLTLLRLPAATGMLRGMLVLHAPPRPRVDSASMLNDASDASIDEFIAELRALGNMAVIA